MQQLDDLQRLAMACLADVGRDQAVLLGHEVGLPPWLSFRASAGAGDNDRFNRPTLPARRWRADELAFLDENIGHMDLADIAAALGRSPNAVKIQAYRRGVGLRQARAEAGVYTGREAAQLLGLSCSKLISRLIDAGHLVAEVACANSMRTSYRITRQALLDFVGSPVAAICLDVNRIRDPECRAAFLRAGYPTYLSCGEAARRLGIVTNTLVKLANQGYVDGQRWGNWYFREDHLPAIKRILESRRQRDRRGPLRRFSTEEIVSLLAGVSLGYNSADLAARTGRSLGSIECLLRRRSLDLAAHAARLGFLWRPRNDGQPAALLGLPSAFPAYPIAAALEALRRQEMSPADWPHLRAWLRAWFLFWLDGALPSEKPGLLADLALLAHRIRFRIPNHLELEDIVPDGIALLRSIGLDPVDCCWDSRWEPYRLQQRPIPPASLEPRPIDHAPDRVFLADVVPGRVGREE